MNEIPQNWGLRSPSLTLYAFHLRNSINQRVQQPTVQEAPRLWEQLVDLGNKLDSRELQNLPQQLISYQNNHYFPEAEDNLESEYCTLLLNRKKSLDFQIIAQPDGLQFQGLLCPYRLHDSYAIDLTLSSQETFFLPQLLNFNPQYLLLPSHIQASLGQTLLLFGQPIELQENYQGLADACVAQLVPETDKPELINTGYLLGKGNPIFEYESQHKNPSKQLHILVWFECQSMNSNDMDKASELLLYLLWFRHKIQYVYHESRWCDRQLKQLYNRIEQHRNSFSQIFQSPERQRLLRQLLTELREIDIEYVGYLGNLDSHENTIAINEENYRAKLEKLGALPETDLSVWQQFLDYVQNKLQRQIQADRSFLAPGRNLLQHLKATVQESIDTLPIESQSVLPSRDERKAEANPKGEPMPYIAADQKLLDCTRAVARVTVPKIVNGNMRKIPTGTGWLVTSELALTCWHVIEARDPKREPSISASDLQKQIANSVFTFEFTEAVVGIEYGLVQMEHDNLELDYAVVRLRDRPDSPLQHRKFLRLEADIPFTLATQLYVIQHPKGQPQQRSGGFYKSDLDSNRILHSAPTEEGTSGAPVLNVTNFQVVALHNGENEAQKLREATKIKAILSDLQHNRPKLYDEIIAAQSQNQE